MELRQLAERHILRLVCQGGSPTRKSSCSLGSRSARNHVATIYRKIDAHRRGAAIDWARKQVGANAPAGVMHLYLSAGTKTDHLPL
jgi:DNA-binding CsgD family transcriptional regulator